MAKIIIDDGLATELTVNVDSVLEDVIGGTLAGNRNVVIPVGGTAPVIPALTTQNPTTVAVYTDDDVEMPVLGTYNRVTNYSYNYYDADRTFAFHIALGYQPINN